MKDTYNLLFILLFFQITCFSQNYNRISIPFYQNGVEIPMPFAGGLNNPQLASVDLNDDGIEDLFVFDKEGEIHLPFLMESGAYQYAPTYANNFPKCFQWVLLKDYNKDGIKDLFTYSDYEGFDGIRVFKGFYANQQLAFEQQFFTDFNFSLLVYTDTDGILGTIPAILGDLPTVADIDGDEDLDILAYTQGGGYVGYFQNQSAELGYQSDSLIFELVDACWGKFVESGTNDGVILSNEIGSCASNFTNPDNHQSPIHGASSLLALNMDGDADSDLLLGDITSQQITFLENNPTSNIDFITEVQFGFPSMDFPVDINYMPAAFQDDFDGDGQMDLIFAPYVGNSENRAVAWFYKNTGTNNQPIFEYQQDDFLVEQILDLGSGAYPNFVDYNADGLLDLVVGNHGYFSEVGLRDARLILFENIGTKEIPQFDLITDDWLNMSQFSPEFWAYAPTFGDLDGDGDADLLMGTAKGNLFYLQNIAPPDSPMIFDTPIPDFMAIDIGQDAVPQLIDINQDGLLDLVLGEQNGNLNYFENIGNLQNSIFESIPNNDKWGDIDENITGASNGFTSPHLFLSNDTIHLFLGTEISGLKYFTAPMNAAIQFTQNNENFGRQTIGVHLHPTLADLNNDGFLDLLIGNFRGGLSGFNTTISQTDSLTNIQQNTYLIQPHIAPNPVQNEIHIQHLPLDAQIQIFTLGGELLLQSTSNSIDIQHFIAGIYVVEIRTDEGVWVEKVVVE